MGACISYKEYDHKNYKVDVYQYSENSIKVEVEWNNELKGSGFKDCGWKSINVQNKGSTTELVDLYDIEKVVEWIKKIGNLPDGTIGKKESIAYLDKFLK